MPQIHRRHWTLTTFLVCSIVLHMLLGISDTFASRASWDRLAPHIPYWYWKLWGIRSFAFVVCAVALLRWQKWGFWGICVLACVVPVSGISAGFPVGKSLLSLVYPVLLFGLLRLGGERAAWRQMNGTEQPGSPDHYSAGAP